MRKILHKLASLRLTLAGMVALIVMALVTYKEVGPATEWLAMPIGVLAVNLFAALLTNANFRQQSGLLIFHICLLAVLLLAGTGLLIRFDGHVELTEGETFRAANVQLLNRGLLHAGDLDAVQFTQGKVEVNYGPGLVRLATRSEISIRNHPGSERRVRVGDRQSLGIKDYRFITTFNKGLALIVTWAGDDGQTATGSINFPSYPLLEWKQVNQWTTPGGQQVQLELVPDVLPLQDAAWTLRSDDIGFSVILSGANSAPRVLRAGDSTDLGSGSLIVRELRLWMGYRIDYNPVLPWLFTAAILGIFGLGIHFRTKFRTVQKSGVRSSVQIGGANAFGSVD